MPDLRYLAILLSSIGALWIASYFVWTPLYFIKELLPDWAPEFTDPSGNPLLYRWLWIVALVTGSVINSLGLYVAWASLRDLWVWRQFAHTTEEDMKVKGTWDDNYTDGGKAARLVFGIGLLVISLSILLVGVPILFYGIGACPVTFLCGIQGPTSE